MVLREEAKQAYIAPSIERFRLNPLLHILDSASIHTGWDPVPDGDDEDQY